MPVRVNDPKTAPGYPLSLTNRSAVFGQINAALDTIEQALQAGPPMSKSQRKKLAAKWHNQMNNLSRAAADTLDDGTKFLPPGMTLQGQDLREQEEDTRELKAINDRIISFGQILNDTLLTRRAALYDNTYMVVRTVNGVLQLPITSEENRKNLSKVAAPMTGIANQVVQDRLSTAANNKALKDKAAQELAQAKAENQTLQNEKQVLRGNDLPTPTTPQPSTKKGGRKVKR